MRIPTPDSPLGPAFCAAVLVLLAAGVSGQHHLFSFPGTEINGHSGFSVQIAGDVDRDGHADLVIGAPFVPNWLAVGAAEIRSGFDGRLLHSFSGTAPNDNFGCAVAGAGDVDGDGHADVVIGAFDEDGAIPDVGSARVLSGADGHTVWAWTGVSLYGLYGHAVSGAGDVDGDGRADVVVGAPADATGGAYAGMVQVRSGRTGVVLHAFVGAPGDGLGYSVAGVGDVDGDGRDDVAAGGYLANARTGRVLVWSGRNGTVLHTWDGPAAGALYGSAVAAAGDVDGDGRPDVIVGGAGYDTAEADVGIARVHSGRTGAILHTFVGTAGGDRLGSAVAGAGDGDGDGLADLLVGVPYADTGGTDAGEARVYAGSDGSLLQTFEGAAAGDHAGRALHGGTDVDADNVADVAIGSPDAAGTAPPRAGLVQVMSVVPRSLTTDTHRISVGTGGTQTFRLAAGTGHAGAGYWVLGSLSGTRPGFPIGSVTVPVNPDGYLLHTALFPNQPPLLSTAGSLDGSGTGQAAFSLPRTVPALAGLVAHHAYVVFEPPYGPFVLASNPVPLRLEP